MKTSVFQASSLQLLNLPKAKSHKGENGRVLVIGGSSLFHSASLWAAELLAHFVDLVFYYSPSAINQKLVFEIKQRFRNGIVITKKDLITYILEADVILIGPGMLRQGKEGALTKTLVNRLLLKFPQKKFVLDAGALQQLNINRIRRQHLLTPHWYEYGRLFGKPEPNFNDLLVSHPATYLVKQNGVDYVFSWQRPNQLIKINIGNQGLTKGGSGDLLAALAAAFYVKNPAYLASAAASFVLKYAADKLYQKVGPFYTTGELLETIPSTFWQLLNLKTQTKVS
jgi:NAD(P)H-hydrate epimerase